MERFIRKKYQEKSLSDGKPEPPRRDDTSPTTYSRTEEPQSPPPPLPPKKGRFFGFGLRTSSSVSNLSKHNKKKLPKEPRVDSAFRISADDYDSMTRMADARFEMTDAELQKKLSALRDMGFTDTDRNTNLLRRLGGNVERTIERLVKEGPSETTTSSSTSRRPDSSANNASSRTSRTTSAPGAGPVASSEPSYNPFTQVTSQQTFGLSLTTPQQPANPPAQTCQSNNPFGAASNSQNETGLEQSMQSMQLSHPLFPHSTGGYPSQPAPLQNPRLQYSMTPPVPSTQFQPGYVASPPAMSMNTNPFFQSQSSAGPGQATVNNPFFSQPVSDHAPAPASPSLNPFFNYQSFQPGQPPPAQQQRQSSLPATLNPFGLPPPPQSPSQTAQPSNTPQFHPQDPFGTARQNPFDTGNQHTHNPFQGQQQQQRQGPQAQGSQNPMANSAFPSFQYGQPQAQQQPQPQPQPQIPQYQQQGPFQQQFAQQQPQQLTPQQSGRYDKNSILALYNYPQLAPKPLASIPEPDSETVGASQQHQQQQVSPTPSGDIYTQPNAYPQAKRSATMPAALSSMHSAGGSGSRNPFLTNTANANTNSNLGVNANIHPGATGHASPSRPQGAPNRHHASADSVSISNLESGRHSPDAFASLSARSIR